MKKILFFLLFPSVINAQIITTIAGTGALGFSGDGGPATNAQVNYVYGIAVDDSGDVYFSDYFNHRVRRIDGSTGIISTVAGTGTIGFSGDGGAATAAQLDHPAGVCLNNAGTVLYIVDDFNHVVRKVLLATGTISTFAGVPGVAGSMGDGGPATAAKFDQPVGIWADGADNIYIACPKGNFVRKIDAVTWMASRFAGALPNGCNVGDGGPAISAGLMYPFNGCRDAYGNTYFTQNYSGVITVVRKVDAGTNIIHTFAGNCIFGYSGDGGPATDAKMSPEGIASDPWGNVYLADNDNGRLRLVDTNGLINTISANPASGSSADGIPLSTAKVHPQSLCFDKLGNLYIGEQTRIRKVSNVFVPPPPGSLKVSAIASELGVEVFPNPSGGIFTVRQKESVKAEIRIFNVIGEQVYENLRPTLEQRIDLSGNPAGIYILHVRGGQSTMNRRILVD